MPNDSFLHYNALDGVCMVEAHNKFWPDLATGGFDIAYNMTIDLLPVLMFMQTRGIRVSMDELEKTKAQIIKSAAGKQEELNRICGRELNVNSPKDCQTYFYVEKGISPYHNDEGRITVDDLALQRMARGTAKRAGLREAKLVQEIRGLHKLKSTYMDIEFDADQRIRCSYNPRGTKFGRLSSSATVFGTGCVPGDAEVLTLQGWIPISKWNPIDSIAQFDKDSNQISFVKAGLHTEASPGALLTLQGEQVGQALTPNHRVLYRPKLKGKFAVATAQAMLDRNTSVIPLSGEYSGSYYPEAPKLLVAALADGSFEFNRVRLAFKKERKISRFLNLCREYNIKVDEQASSREEYRRFAFDRPASWPKDKRWGCWVLDLHATAADDMLQELGHWDGIIRGDSHVLYSADRTQVEWVATLAHLRNRSATMGMAEQSEGSWSDTIMYRVNIKPRNYAYVESKHWGVTPYKDSVYCPIVPATFWLMRYQGKISITGNTNLQNLPPEFKQFLVADEGYVFWEIDKRMAEWVIVAYLANDASMLKAIEDGLDVHSYTASMMFDTPIELVQLDSKLVGMNTDPELLGQLRGAEPALTRFLHKFPRTMSGRQMGKKSNHGLNYDEGYAKFSLINEVEQSEGKRCVELYHRVYPGVRQTFHAGIKYQLQKDRTLTNCFGRKIRFLDQWGPDLWKAGYSALPQSTQVDGVNRGMVAAYHDDWLCEGPGGIDILAQSHDAILTQVPMRWFENEGAFEGALEAMYKYLSPELEYNGRKFQIDNDSKIGLNWGGYHRENNPKGMREIKSPADVQRVLGELGCLTAKTQTGSTAT